MTAPEPDAIAAWDKARKAYFWEGGKVTDLVRAADALRAALAPSEAEAAERQRLAAYVRDGYHLSNGERDAIIRVLQGGTAR